MAKLFDRSARRLRRDCEARLSALALPAHRGVAELCEHLSRRRGRPIVTVPVATGDLPAYGLWIAASDTDIVAYPADTSRSHQEHIIAHELAHMICGHRGEPGRETLTDEGASLLFPELDPAVVRATLQRGGYTDPQEREAEMTASLLRERADLVDPEAVWEAAPDDAEVLARIEDTLGRRGPALGAAGHRWPANPRA
ncbi:toxin [Saccharothrix xinjiangensis]|uniref:Toxin n=1 Tax=Saccharothrix xinjiangensis TaxID=204798 RepID=A0ABV9Y6Y3_9PSEU